MPILESAQGLQVQSLQTELCTAWTMNFAASCNDVSERFMDTRDGRTPQVHPMFLASCVEVVGAFASIYKAGLTKDEIVRNTFVHHFCDVQIERPLISTETIRTEIKLARVSQKKNGVHTGTSYEHFDVAGKQIARGYFGGVVLGLMGGDKEKASTTPYIPEPLKLPETFHKVETVELVIPPTAAHVWDACIRNPRSPKAASGDINVHTNIGLALAAGLPARTMNGLCLLSMVVSHILKQLPRETGDVKRVCCTFSSPLYLRQTDVRVLVHLKVAPTRDKIFFDVTCPETKAHFLRNGALVFRTMNKSHL